MKRRQLLAMLCGTASLPFNLVAQERKLPRLAIVNLILPVDRMSRSEAGSEGMRAFLAELARLGYVENETIKIERWSAGGNADRVAALAQEVVRSGPDVIHAISARLVQHLNSATSEIPIIAYTGDPVGFGFAASMSRPGGNVTGLSSDTGIDLVGKYLELLKELTPTASRLAFLAAKEVWEGPYARALFDAAEMKGIVIISARLESPITEAEYRRFFEACASEQAHAVLVAETPENFAHRSLLLELARDYRLVGMYPTPDFARSGGVIAYGRDITHPMRRMAHYVNQIIKGAKPGDLPFEQPTRLRLVINLEAAKALNLTIPPTLLARADEVIE